MKDMNIKILGSGCMNCKTMEKRTIEALHRLSIDADVEKVENFQKMSAYGIMRTPGLVINEKLVVSGFVPTVEKITELLLAHRTD